MGDIERNKPEEGKAPQHDGQPLESDSAWAPPSKKEEQREIASAFNLFLQLGISMSACLFLGFFIGKTLDGWLNTSPALLVVFTFLGAVTSFKVLYDLAIKRWMK